MADASVLNLVISLMDLRNMLQAVWSFSSLAAYAAACAKAIRNAELTCALQMGTHHFSHSLIETEN